VQSAAPAHAEPKVSTRQGRKRPAIRSALWPHEAGSQYFLREFPVSTSGCSIQPPKTPKRKDGTSFPKVTLAPGGPQRKSPGGWPPGRDSGLGAKKFDLASQSRRRFRRKCHAGRVNGLAALCGSGPRGSDRLRRSEERRVGKEGRAGWAGAREREKR